MNILLLGLRGSGKSTVGALLAQQLGRPFVDLDQKALALLGAASVREVWQVRGEKVFREAEVRALAEVLASQGQVVALGGGTPMAPGAAEILRKAQQEGAAILVYLQAEAGVLRRRLAAAGDDDRPSLSGADPLLEIEAVLSVRDPLYRELADHIVSAEEAPGAVVAEIMQTLGD